MAGPLRGGGEGYRAGPLRKKELIMEPFFPKFQRPLSFFGLSSRGGSGLGLNVPAFKRRTFFAASIDLVICLFFYSSRFRVGSFSSETFR